MNKLIHDPTSHGQKVIFSTSDELAEWLRSQHAGILFAINKHATVIYTVIKMDGEAPWAVSSFNEFHSISFNKLVPCLWRTLVSSLSSLALLEVELE